MKDQPIVQAKQERAEPILSHRATNGMMLEAVSMAADKGTILLCFKDGEFSEHRSMLVDGRLFVPYAATNNLLSHRVILLASAAEPYESVVELLGEIRGFIHRYADLDTAFEEVAAHYVLMTWGYDVFNEVPYLRVRGDFGSGKSRFLLTVGSLCYKPIFASGASTVSPLFRLIDQAGGTLTVDEADFWASDERAEIIKILNNGNARGFPVLRSEVTPNKEFNPRAFDIYGPKIIATRSEFQDQALESRCLTAQLGVKKLRSDIPVSLPRSFHQEAQGLRNKLLRYRFDRFASLDEPPLERVPGLAPRRAQIIAPLLRVAVDEASRRRLIAFASGTDVLFQVGERENERRILMSMRSLLQQKSSHLPLALVAQQFMSDWSGDYPIEVSPRWVGAVLRRLGLEPQKSNGVFVIPSTDYPQLGMLIEKRLGEMGDEGEVAAV